MWLHNPAKKRHLSPKLQLRWEGPWLIAKKLSDVIVRIQQKSGSKSKVVHVDRLKLCVGETVGTWANEPKDGVEESLPVDQVIDVPDVSVSSEELVDEASNVEAPLVSHDVREMSDPENGDNCVDVSGQTPPRRYPKRTHKLPLRYR